MSTGSSFKSDLLKLNNYFQNSATDYVSTKLVEVLRDFFSRDSFYSYRQNPWGFPSTPSEQGLPYDAGLHDDSTTRLFISQSYRQDGIFYPSILIKPLSLKSVPISFNRNKFVIKWENITYTDTNNISKVVQRPIYYQLNGAYNVSISILIETRSPQSRQDLIDLVTLFFIDTHFEDLINAGIVVTDISAGSFSESEDRNEKLFVGSVDLQIRSEWEKRIPISSIMDTINFCIEFGDTLKIPFTPAPNLTIHAGIALIDKLNDLIINDNV